MYTKQEIIIQYMREGKSQREIARALQISRKTVKKYIDQYHLSKKEQQKHTGPELLRTYLSSPPKYRCPNRPRRTLTHEVQHEIDRLLELNMNKRKKGLHKQLLKKCDILSYLHQKGYKIGYTTVCNYIRDKEKRLKEAFIRQRYEPGATCEFDWGEVKLIIDGQRKSLQLAVFTAGYSNYRYAYLFHRQDTLAFQEAHIRFFKHIPGVYHQMVYDNMRVVVARFIGKKEKEPTQALIDLKGHYGFHHRFCNNAKGNEKGHVERSVEYIRRKAFGIQDSFLSIKAAQEHLENVVSQLNNTHQQGSQKTAVVLFEEECPYLWEAPLPFSCFMVEPFKVDKYATISYRGNRYSVSDRLVGKFVEAKIFSNHLEIYYQEKHIATHNRSYGLHQWVIQLGHYLDTFKRKPGALPGSEALAQSPKFLKQIYEVHYQDSPKDFIELVLYCQKHKIAQDR